MKTGITTALSERLHPYYLADEAELIRGLLARIEAAPELDRRIHDTAVTLVQAMHAGDRSKSGVKALLAEYDLSSEEGIVLMCLAEALLRIPDADTADALIVDKLTTAHFRKHLGESDSLFVNASTWALLLTGESLQPQADPRHDLAGILGRLLGRLEEPLIRGALRVAMTVLARQFVIGRDIAEAQARAGEDGNRGYLYSFDMIGEAALCRADCDRYFAAYSGAIAAVGVQADTTLPLRWRPGVSVKLSALCPRFEQAQQETAAKETAERLAQLARQAAGAGIGLTVDAEESERLEITLRVFEKVCRSFPSGEPRGFGLAVQAYQKRCLPVLDWVQETARKQALRIPIRLVKGAYWDTEIKHAQQQGLREYPVFTRKANTDVSYLAAVNHILAECPDIYPQFATHNAHTVAYVYHHAGTRDYEFQRLHGMGEELYAAVIDPDRLGRPCRVYAPVGPYRELLPYLMRRLLENGANTSFVNQARQTEEDLETLVRCPLEQVRSLGEAIRHPTIPLPGDLFAPDRVNSLGINLNDDHEVRELTKALSGSRDWTSRARPVQAPGTNREYSEIRNPADHADVVGLVLDADAGQIEAALASAEAAWPRWNATPASERAAILNRAARLFEQHHGELIALCVREAGRTLHDSVGELREAVDFLRYYAAECRRHFSEPLALPGVTGESNALYLHGRGTFLCISPWNFPLAIFTGQIAAALAAGNCALAKPAEQTPLIGCRVVELLHEAGVPVEALAFLPGSGPDIGAQVLPDPRIAGVAFTGATETARLINRILAERTGPIAVLIAETGGVNAMIADSSALPQQVALDAARSAFNSAGQRCSALRVLYVQEEIAETVFDLLAGYMQHYRIGDPASLETDIGPVIDGGARATLQAHLGRMQREGRLIHQCPIGALHDKGNFFGPALVEIERIGQLQGEVFGPILHVIRYAARDLDGIIEEINACGYGLTLGVQSRIVRRADRIRQLARVGNVYVNRDMIGATVGAQPFGGRGLSGTGPKAGGPHYLLRFATEQTCTINTSAIGGDTRLLQMTRPE